MGKYIQAKKNSDGTWDTGRSRGNTDEDKKFTYVDGKNTVTIGELADGRINQGSIEITLTQFSYNLNKLSGDQTKVLGSLMDGSYWLASPCVYCISYYAYFYVRCMYYGNINDNALFRSGGDVLGASDGVRAVVYI